MGRPKNRNFSPATYVALRMVADGRSAADFARVWQVNKSNATRRLAVLARRGLLEKGARSAFQVWRLTAPGKIVLEECRRVFGDRNFEDLLGLKEQIRFREHDLLFRFAVVNYPVDFWRRLEARAGTYSSSLGAVKGRRLDHDGTGVFFTSKSVLILPKPVWAGNVEVAFFQALELAFSFKHRLESWFPGLRLEGTMDLCRHQIAMLGGFSKWVPEGYSYKSDRLVVDASTGEREIETVDPHLAKPDMHKIMHFMEALVRDKVTPELVEDTVKVVEVQATVLASQDAVLKELRARLERLEGGRS